MTHRPQASEIPAEFQKYIERVPGDDILAVLRRQMDEALHLFGGLSEETSLHRYAEGRWSIREILSHLNDTERVFAFRALWFARNLPSPLPSYDQDRGGAASGADAVSWTSHVEEFTHVRLATLSLLSNLPAEAWQRSGIASGNSVTVLALAYFIAGHFDHHLALLKERYL